jgi:Omp85 superfamily domain
MHDSTLRSCIGLVLTPAMWVTVALVTLTGHTATAQSNRQTPEPGSEPRVQQPAELLAEPPFIARAIDFATRTIGQGTGTNNGLYAEFGHLPTGAGWLSLGPGFRRWLSQDRVVIEGSTAISWRAYKMAQARIELPRLMHSRVVAGSQVRWQDLTQVTYFGDGPDSLESDRSEYRLKSTDLVGYASVRPAQWLSIGGRVGWIPGTTLGSPGGIFQRGNPPAQLIFPHNPAFIVDAQPGFTYAGVSLGLDTRDHPRHPTRGGVYRAAWASYRDRDAGTFSFRQAEAEAAHFLPLAGARVVVAMHGWLAASETVDGQTVPLYFEPALGGHNTLRGYTDYRFHDRNLLVVNVESRVAVWRHLDAAVFADAGNVAPSVSDLNLDRTSYGIGLRIHSARATFGRLDLAHGTEGWRLMFRLSDPLHLARVTRHLAPMPFVP